MERQKEKGLELFHEGMKALWKLMEHERLNMIKVTGWMIFFQTLSIFFALTVKFVFDELFRIYETGRMSFFMIAIILGMFVLKIVSFYFKRFLQESKFQESIIELENYWPVKVEAKLLELTLGYHERENTGKKVTRINRGCNQMVDIISTLHSEFLPQIFFLLLNVTIIMVIDWKLGLVFLAPFPLVVWINIIVKKKYGPIWEEWDRKNEISGGLFCQTIQNIKTVQGYAQEEREKDSLARIRQEMKNMDLKATLEIQRYYFYVNVLGTAFFTLTVFLGIYFVLKGTSTAGTVVYLIATGSSTFSSLFVVMNQYVNLSKKFIAVIKVKKLLDEEPEIKNSPNVVIPDDFTGQFNLKEIKFRYPTKDASVIDGITLDISPGQMVAFVGKSGEGKSTFFRLLCRMYDVDEGVIELDGRDIRKLDLFWYRRLFAIVPQEVDIFDASLLENVRYSCPHASEDQIEEAMRAAYLDVILEDKEKFPDGALTEVGERGVRLSGGERQRVGIARAYVALLNGARVLVLDEATSHLDSESEKAIQDMIGRLRKQRSITIVVVAHRLSTIRRADTIYVIDGGRIVESGNDYSLDKQNGLYAKLRELQDFKEFDLEN